MKKKRKSNLRPLQWCIGLLGLFAFALLIISFNWSVRYRCPFPGNGYLSCDLFNGRLTIDLRNTPSYPTSEFTKLYVTQYGINQWTLVSRYFHSWSKWGDDIWDGRHAWPPGFEFIWVRESNAIFMQIPLIGATILLVCLFCALLFIHFKRRRACDVGHCAKCAYDLRGCTSSRCPECGMQFDQQAVSEHANAAAEHKA